MKMLFQAMDCRVMPGNDAHAIEPSIRASRLLANGLP